jgi:hypothetical protein
VGGVGSGWIVVVVVEVDGGSTLVDVVVGDVVVVVGGWVVSVTGGGGAVVAGVGGGGVGLVPDGRVVVDGGAVVLVVGGSDPPVSGSCAPRLTGAVLVAVEAGERPAALAFGSVVDVAVEKSVPAVRRASSAGRVKNSPSAPSSVSAAVIPAADNGSIDARVRRMAVRSRNTDSTSSQRARNSNTCGRARQLGHAAMPIW